MLCYGKLPHPVNLSCSKKRIMTAVINRQNRQIWIVIIFERLFQRLVSSRNMFWLQEKKYDQIINWKLYNLVAKPIFAIARSLPVPVKSWSLRILDIHGLYWIFWTHFFFLGGGGVYNIHSKKILFGKSQVFCAVRICLSFAKTRKPSGFRHFCNKRNLRSFRGI